MKNKVSATRKTTESNITVKLDFEGLATDYRAKINTPIPFLSHMIEHIAYRSGIGITTELTLDKFDLSHVVCEDLGMTLGRGVREYVGANILQGIPGFGDGIGIIDEAYACAAVSFESRSYFDFTYDKIILPELVEGMSGDDLVTVLEGFCQGAKCTLHIDIKKGTNGHHIWEAVYRAFGIALRNALTVDPLRAGRTAGVAGPVTFETEVK